MPRLIQCLTFGSCGAHDWQRTLISQGFLADPFLRFGIPGRPYALSSGAAVQLHEICVGERIPPDAIRRLAFGPRLPLPGKRLEYQKAYQRRMKPGRERDETQIVLVELSTPIEPFIGDSIVNLNMIRHCIVEPLRNTGIDRKIVSRWRVALSNDSEDLKEMAEDLLRNWPSNLEDGGLARFGVENLSVRRLGVDEMVRDLESLRDRLGAPMVLQLYSFRFMPDGRAVEWPAGFRAEQSEVARRMGLPTFDMAPLVSRLGFKRLIGEDMNHWRPESYPLQAHLTYDFLADILDRPSLETYAESLEIRRDGRALIPECADTPNQLLEATKNAPPLQIAGASSPSGTLIGRARVARQALAGLATHPQAERGDVAMRQPLGPAVKGARLSKTAAEPAALRLEVFSDIQIGGVRRMLGAVRAAPWPKIDGCLAVLFSSRSGSTYLARDLERLFEIGRLREALRPPRVKGRPVASIVEPRRDAWFSFKAGGHSVIAAELCGFFDTYLDATSFILLLRRDIVAQAVSGMKAKQTGQYHSTGRESSTPRRLKGVATYDLDQIARYVSVVASSVQRLRLYAERTERPWQTLLYEDFAGGDFTRPMAVCDAFGIPRRAAGARILSRPVERIGDATNEAWTERFREEMDAPTREIIERYVAEI